MLLLANGEFIYDLADNIADELVLIISNGEHCEKFLLSREKVEYYNYVCKNNDDILHCDVSAQKVKNITVNDSEQIFLSVCNAGLFNFTTRIDNNRFVPVINGRFLFCRLEDGSQYGYSTTDKPSNEFESILKLLKDFIFLSTDDFFHCFSQTHHNGFKTVCCDAVISSMSEYCPACGKKLTASDVNPSDIPFDPHETVWICDECMEGTSFKYMYCGNCGKKRK